MLNGSLTECQCRPMTQSTVKNFQFYRIICDWDGELDEMVDAGPCWSNERSTSTKPQTDSLADIAESEVYCLPN